VVEATEVELAFMLGEDGSNPPLLLPLCDAEVLVDLLLAPMSIPPPLLVALVLDDGRFLLLLRLILRLMLRLILLTLMDMEETEVWSSMTSAPFAWAVPATCTLIPSTTLSDSVGKTLGRGTGPGSREGKLSETNLLLHKLLCNNHKHKRKVVYRDDP